MASGKTEKINLDLLLEYSASLPASPRIFARLSGLIENEDSSLDVISSLVKMDPGLAAQILKVTNSAYYGGSIKVIDLDTAISRIGFREVQKVLAMVVAHECFYQAIPTYGITATEFADECIDVAVASEVLAKRSGFEPSNPYICGLLHRIGKLAINLYLEKMDQATDLSKAIVDRKIEEVEQEVLGITHLRAGAELLKHWQFDAAIWQPIKNQASPIHAVSFERESSILTLAIWISKTIREGYDPEAKLPEEIAWALDKLGIDALDVAMLSDDARFEINDRKNMLSMLL